MERCLIEKSLRNVEYGVRKMLDRYWWIRNKINTTSAFSNSETEERYELMKELKYLENYLRLLDIQSFEVKSEWLVFKIK